MVIVSWCFIDMYHRRKFIERWVYQVEQNMGIKSASRLSSMPSNLMEHLAGQLWHNAHVLMLVKIYGNKIVDGVAVSKWNIVDWLVVQFVRSVRYIPIYHLRRWMALSSRKWMETFHLTVTSDQNSLIWFVILFFLE